MTKIPDKSALVARLEKLPVKSDPRKGPAVHVPVELFRSIITALRKESDND